MQINKPIVKDLRDILNNVLNDNERLEQFDVHVGNASFSDTEVTFKLNVKVKGSKPKDQTDLEEYLSMTSRWGTDLDKDRVVNYRGMDLKLVGYKRANRKYPFILQDVKTSKRYKFPTDWVNDNFSIEKVAS
jgi:uncharacterized protein (DUF927 family)